VDNWGGNVLLNCWLVSDNLVTIDWLTTNISNETMVIIGGV
jgi:hypothetical protein